MANNKVISTRNLSLDQDVLLDPDFLHEELSRKLDPSNFRDNYLLQELLSKLPRDGISAEVRASNAINKMLETEVKCATVNHSGYGTSTPRNYFEQVIIGAQRIVADVLGDFSFDIFESSSFSSGATVSRTRKFGDPYYKYHSTNPVSVTPGCYKYAYALITATPIWCSMGAWDNITMSIGNNVTTVPKKTEIDRTIAKEPCLNMALQRSVGSYIRGRLKRFGINLNDQTRNQRLARKGSIDGSLATIDLAAASDSISRRFVMDLLPFDWYDKLDKLRSHYGVLPSGETIMWEKFSSMGNGFTFELESLLFFAISASVAKIEGHDYKDVSVYGDDIIVPTSCARNLIVVLDDFGFSTNLDKTFIEGSFRESCGKHYDNGIDVSPFYIRKPIDSVPRVIWFLNSLRNWATHSNLVDPRVFEIWKSIKRKFVPKELLGGRRFDDQGSVVSPEYPRKSLVPLLRSKRINGIRAYLRYFQYQAGFVEVRGKDVYVPLQYARSVIFNKYDERRAAVKGMPPDWRSMPQGDITQFSLRDNPDGDWWPPISMFPQEIDGLV